MRFQELNGLVANGYLDPGTLEKLQSAGANANVLSYSMHGADVVELQTGLKELNYIRARDISGYFTSVTEQAVRLFQKNNGLDADGRAGRATMSRLMSESAVRAAAPVSAASSTPNYSGSERLQGHELTPRPASPGAFLFRGFESL